MGDVVMRTVTDINHKKIKLECGCICDREYSTNIMGCTDGTLPSLLIVGEY
jgi:hypothetical protein